MASILNSDIYELSDLREALDNKDYKLANKITLQFVEAAAIIIDNSNPFISSFLNETNSHRKIDYHLSAPAAVLISSDGKKSIFNLYLNPIAICEIFKDHEDKFFIHFAALIKHEMLHLIFNHQSEEEELFDKDFIKKYHQLTNICQDAKINTTKELISDEWVNDTGVTYKSLKKQYKSFKISESEFDKSNWIELFKLLKEEYSSNYDKQQQLIKNLQDAINNLLNQNNNSSQGSNSQDNNNQNNNDNSQDGNNNQKQKQLEQAVKDALDELEKETGGNVQLLLGEDILESSSDGKEKSADKVQINMSINDVINSTIADNDLTEDEIKSRGLLPGDVVNNIFHRDENAEAIDITRYYRKGINRILKTTKPNRHRLKLRTSNFSLHNSQKHERGKEVIAYVDTSGSISDEEINFFLTQLYETTKKYHINLTAIPFDYDCYHENAIEINSSFDFDFPVGRGGTRASSAFEDMKEQNYSPDNQFVIIFTDGYTENEIEESCLGEYEDDVLWVIDDKSSISNDYDKAKKKFPGDIAFINYDRKFQYAFPDKIKNLN